ncbi:MAG: hypothetical protein Q9222_004520 [Ikaeria aurantiellina]
MADSMSSTSLHIQHSSTNVHLPTVASALRLRTGDDRDDIHIDVVGSVRTIRRQKQRTFVEIGDGSTVQSLQAVLNPKDAQGLSTGSFVAVRGLWRSSPPDKKQAHELHAEDITVIGTADSEKYPIQQKFQTPEFLRTIPHLRLRLPIHALLSRLRSESDFLLAQFFRHRDFLRLQPPIITSSDCEGAGEVFSVGSKDQPRIHGKHESTTAEEGRFFRKPKFLTVSSQLHLEAYMEEHAKVWTFSPTFRAEKSDTPRHVSEFWMLEAEIRTQSLEELMDLVEDMIKWLVRGLKTTPLLDEVAWFKFTRHKQSTPEADEDQKTLPMRWEKLQTGPWPRITYAEAVQTLHKSVAQGESAFIHPPSWSTGLQLEHERYIAAKVGQGKPVFVTDYPKNIKPFYMLPSITADDHHSASQETVACFDLLLPDVCEVAGGSLREHRLQELEESMNGHSLDLASRAHGNSPHTDGGNSSTSSEGNLDWYLDLRRFGSVPHGGFGFGFDRFLCYLAGIHNIKDVVSWPRYHGRCDC